LPLFRSLKIIFCDHIKRIKKKSVRHWLHPIKNNLWFTNIFIFGIHFIFYIVINVVLKPLFGKIYTKHSRNKDILNTHFAIVLATL
jgi:hypothetical protein